MPRFSDLALSTISAFHDLAQAEHDLNAARDKADALVGSVVEALKSVPGGKVALVLPDGRARVYSLTANLADYKVEDIAGDFDLPDDPASPVAPDPEPEGPDGPLDEAAPEPDEDEDVDRIAWIPDMDPDFLSNFAVS